MTESAKFPFRTLLPLAIATIFSIFAMGVIIPILPFFVISLGGDAAHAPYIFSAFSLAALLSAPLWGAMSDRYGRKTILLISMVGTLLSYAWLGFADSLWQLYAARMVAGLSAGWMATLQAYVADVTNDDQRAKGMGLMGASFGIGFTFGPAMGALIMSSDRLADGGMLPVAAYHIPSLIALISSGLSLLVIGFFLTSPSIQHQNQALQKQIGQYGVIARWFSPDALRNRKILSLLLLYFSVFLVFTAIEGVFAIWAAAKLGYGPKQVGYLLAYGGFITILVQGGLIGRLSKSIGEVNCVKLALLSLFLALFSFIIADGILMLLLGMGLLALAMGLHNPGMQSLISKAAPDHHKGRVLGTAQSVMSLARVLGPAWGGIVFGLYGVSAPYMVGLIAIACIGIFGSHYLSSFTLTRR
ncbi:MAG: MFS transporter [Alphaproteobacteria bacterium]